jgi:NADH dehydrogenase
VADRIVVVGGGFAGFWAAVAARRIAGSRLSIMLVSREPKLQIRPRLYEAAPNDLAVDLSPLLEKVGVDFVAGDVSTLEVPNRLIWLRAGNASSYTRLVVATGSCMQRPKVLGADLAHSIDTQRDAIVSMSDWLKSFELRRSRRLPSSVLGSPVSSSP